MIHVQMTNSNTAKTKPITYLAPFAIAGVCCYSPMFCLLLFCFSSTYQYDKQGSAQSVKQHMGLN